MLFFVAGVAFLEKSLFTAYTYTLPTASENEQEEEMELPPFQISLFSLLETLQILGITDAKDRWSHRDDLNGVYARGGPNATFESRILGMNGICRLSYTAVGDPLSIILEEAGVTTTCELVTYEPDGLEEIPLQKDSIAQKVIMRAGWLHDAITELSSASPTRLTMMSCPTAPYFTLSATGPLGSATVEFSNDPQLLETFQVPTRIVNVYKYSLIKAATRAMDVATKVSIRSDEQGVLSLQFMIEVEGGGYSFVEFRFVPFLPEDGDDVEDD